MFSSSTKILVIFQLLYSQLRRKWVNYWTMIRACWKISIMPSYARIIHGTVTVYFYNPVCFYVLTLAVVSFLCLADIWFIWWKLLGLKDTSLWNDVLIQRVQVKPKTLQIVKLVVIFINFLNISKTQIEKASNDTI